MFDPAVVEKFWGNLNRFAGADACWLWEGETTERGYGRFRVSRKVDLAAHRMSVLLDGRELPPSMVVDHLCRNRLCCNPRHLEVVSTKVNVLRGVGPTAENAARTHCIHGHLLPPFSLSQPSKNARRCLECQKRHDHNYYHSTKKFRTARPKRTALGDAS